MKFFPSRGLLLLVPLSLLPFFAALAERGDRSAQLDFGVEAARKGLWREALFRWEKAHKLSPNNPRILNNLAVASENTGDFEKADGFYQEALRLQPGNRDIRQNYDLFTAFYKEFKSRKDREGAERDTPSPTPPEEAPGAPGKAREDAPTPT